MKTRLRSWQKWVAIAILIYIIIWAAGVRLGYWSRCDQQCRDETADGRSII